MDNSFLNNVFNPELFRQQGYRIIDSISDYMKNILNDDLSVVLPNHNKDELMGIWDGDFLKDSTMELADFVEKVVSQSNHLHHPHYIGHQVAPPLPLSALFDLLGKFLNNASAVFEMGPVNVVMEKRLINWMSGLIGYDESADGIFTSGGTIGNLTALLAARQFMIDYNVWKEGMVNNGSLVVMVPEDAHYSINRAICIMGLGESALLSIPSNDKRKLNIDLLHKLYFDAISNGRKPFCVVGNACSTSTGSYDDLEQLAGFCKDKKIWFHVDAAHGASALLSSKYKSLLKGIDQADSVIWDAHKMMLMPALITAVIFKDGKHSYESFSQKASYLFEKESKEEWFNYAHRTMECTKTMMGLKLYGCLKIYGTELFENYINYTFDLTKQFADIILNSSDFELAVYPECNIICFRYIKGIPDEINILQKTIRKKILTSEKFYIVQTQIKENIYLRCTIINPLTTIDHLKELLEMIRRIV